MQLNVNSIKLRLRKLELYIDVLEQNQQSELDTFLADFTQQLAVERAFQASIEACIDIAAHVVATFQLGEPTESRDVFQFLADAGYLTSASSKGMMALVGLRNRLVHLYWDIDAERLYQYLNQDIEQLRRFRDFTVQLITSEDDSLRED